MDTRSFYNLLGEIVNCDDNGRIRVLFNILNSNKIVKTDFKFRNYLWLRRQAVKKYFEKFYLCKIKN